MGGYGHGVLQNDLQFGELFPKNSLYARIFELDIEAYRDVVALANHSQVCVLDLRGVAGPIDPAARARKRAAHVRFKARPKFFVKSFAFFFR